VPGLVGLWLGIAAQAALIATVISLLARRLLPHTELMNLMPLWFALVACTSVAWHVGQFMPDAFTGAVVLVAWLAASRDASAPGTLTLWAMATVMALMHYTHIPLLLVVALITIAVAGFFGKSWLELARRGIAAVASTGIAIAVMITANGAMLNQWSVSPMGSVFLFARLTEDGVMRPWLTEHCGKDAPEELCAISHFLPQDSQVMLWHGDSPLSSRVWNAPSDDVRWRWTRMLASANRGAIVARPLTFAGASIGSMGRQLISFQALDDLCPTSCGSLQNGPVDVLSRYRPSAVAALKNSLQVKGTTPLAAVRAMSTPFAWLGMILLPPLLFAALRRRDELASSLLIAALVALVANALMGGAFSDVHDRYQSRIIWTVPLLTCLIVLRWQLLSSVIARLSHARKKSACLDVQQAEHILSEASGWLSADHQRTDGIRPNPG
jgi:hypothetical protein